MAKLADVQAGQVWEVRWHDGSLTHVEITGFQSYPVQSGYYPYRTTGSKKRLSARNLATGRHVVIKSAAKLRRRIK
jgi:hypothetical protein